MRYVARLVYSTEHSLFMGGLSNAGHVVFAVDGADGQDAYYMWLGGDLMLLQIGEFTSVRVLDVNSEGIAVGGGTRNDEIEVACTWRSGEPKSLGAPSGAGDSCAFCINDRNLIAGHYETDPDDYEYCAATWTGGDFTRLAPAYAGPTIDQSSHARGISQAGLVVGDVGDGGFVFDGRDFRYLEPPTAVHSIHALRINDHRAVVGCWLAEEEETAFRWRDGRYDPLGVLGGDESVALGINNAGIIIGNSTVERDSEDTHGFVYIDDRMHDLNDCTDSLDGWTIVSAVAINEAEQIAAKGSRGSESAALLLEPA